MKERLTVVSIHCSKEVCADEQHDVEESDHLVGFIRSNVRKRRTPAAKNDCAFLELIVSSVTLGHGICTEY